MQVKRTMDLEHSAKILSCWLKQDLSTSEVLRHVGGSHDRAIKLIRELVERGLLSQEAPRRMIVGRPRHSLRPTALGKRFILECNHLRRLPLYSNENDLRKAVHQAELARKLVERGDSPYTRFWEVTSLVRNIAGTAKAQRSTR